MASPNQLNSRGALSKYFTEPLKVKYIFWVEWMTQLILAISLWERLSSFNPRWFYYSYACSHSLCEGRTSFCTGLISRKLCRFLLMFLTWFTWFFVLLLFPLLITFFVFVHSFWFYFIWHRWGFLGQTS